MVAYRRSTSPRAAAFLAAAITVAMTGCSSTVAGTPSFAGVVAERDPDVSQLDTGNYPVNPGGPLPAAGQNPSLQIILESNRLAGRVVGPWTIEPSLSVSSGFTGRLGQDAGVGETMGEPRSTHVMQGIAKAHGMVAGFTSSRTTATNYHPVTLVNAVLMFPDAAAAAAAAAGFSAQAAPIILAGLPAHPASVPFHPEAMAYGAELGDGLTSVLASFTVHGQYVLYQYAQVKDADSKEASARAGSLVGLTASTQVGQIDAFIPTDPARRAELPMDPTDEQLLSKALSGSTRDIGGRWGGWSPAAWLHFTDDPATAAAHFRDGGVQWVAQKWGRVYLTPNPNSAARLVDELWTDTVNLPAVTISDPVRGFPGASCFERTKDWAQPEDTVTWRLIKWHFMCIGRADRYAFQVFSDDLNDAQQQAAAQYRILAGK